jgi:outer membrane protein insertion porin family
MRLSVSHILITVSLLSAGHPGAAETPPPADASQERSASRAGYSIERIEVRGNQKTHTDRILRSLPIRQGEVLEEGFAEDSRQALYRTQLFKTVHVASKPGSAPNTAVVVVFVDEKRFGDLGVSLDYTELDGFGLAADASHVNLRGEGKIVGAEWGLGERFKYWGFNYTDPFLTKADLIFSLAVRGSSADRDLYRDKDPDARGRYDLERIGGEIGIGRNVRGAMRLLVTYAFEEVRVGGFTRPLISTNGGRFADEIEAAQGRRSLAYFGLNIRRAPLPGPWGSGPGLDGGLSIGFSAPWAGSSGTFLKLQGDAHHHVAIVGSHILSLGGKAGVVLGAEPFYERFFLDGPLQLRGFERREIGPEGGEEFATAEIVYSVSVGRFGRVYGFGEGAAVRRDFDTTPSRLERGATAGIGVLLFNRVDISLGLGTGTLVIKSHRFGGLHVGL